MKISIALLISLAILYFASIIPRIFIEHNKLQQNEQIELAKSRCFALQRDGVDDERDEKCRELLNNLSQTN